MNAALNAVNRLLPVLLRDLKYQNMQVKPLTFSGLVPKPGRGELVKLVPGTVLTREFGDAVLARGMRWAGISCAR